MDEDLRVSLWNALSLHYWKRDFWNCDNEFLISLWMNLFKEAIDDLGEYSEENIDIVRERFSEIPWNKVYDILEFMVQNFKDEPTNQRFIRTCNAIFEREASAYRFIGKQIGRIISKAEISEVEEAMTTPLDVVNAHIEHALELLSDRTSPDYRNSIKESISAVEAICRLIVNDKNATLGQALGVIGKHIEIHGALKKSFENLYGYTSSAEGIRHSLLERNITLRFEDAKFMLVSCSAFVNYLVSKAANANLKI